jgi:hypothetical protein
MADFVILVFSYGMESGTVPHVLEYVLPVKPGGEESKQGSSTTNTSLTLTNNRHSPELDGMHVICD